MCVPSLATHEIHLGTFTKRSRPHPRPIKTESPDSADIWMFLRSSQGGDAALGLPWLNLPPSPQATPAWAVGTGLFPNWTSHCHRPQVPFTPGRLLLSSLRIRFPICKMPVIVPSPLGYYKFKIRRRVQRGSPQGLPHRAPDELRSHVRHSGRGAEFGLLSLSLPRGGHGALRWWSRCPEQT